MTDINNAAEIPLPETSATAIQLFVSKFQEIVIIAAHVARRMADAAEFELGELWLALREKTALHFGSELQFTPHPFLFNLVPDELRILDRERELRRNSLEQFPVFPRKGKISQARPERDGAEQLVFRRNGQDQGGANLHQSLTLLRDERQSPGVRIIEIDRQRSRGFCQTLHNE